MIRYNNIFNKNTLNIFTDASTLNKPNEIVGAPGYVAVIGNNIINEDIKIMRESTNSESELYAILMAIQFALANRDKVSVINIFSDSQFAVFGLREWIFKWADNIKDDKLYNSSKKEVAHQGLFMNIIYTILYYNLQVSFFHNRGHFSKNNIDEFIDLFTKHNFLSDYIDKQTARSIIYYNNKIDVDTRTYLNNTQFPPKLAIPEYLAREDLDLNRYKKLLNI